MKKLFAILIVAMFSFSFSAPTAEATDWGKVIGGIFGSGSSGGSATKVARLAGKIINTNGEPIEGILVTYEVEGNGQQKSVKTNSNGNYVLTVYRSTNAYLTIKGDTWRTQKIQVYNAEDNNVRNYTMYHNYMTGKVTTSNGQPLQGVKLVFEQDGSASGIQEVYTDANGNYKYVIPKANESYWVTISLNGYKLQRLRNYLRDETVWNITMYQ